MKNYKDKQLMEDIYDLVKVCGLSKNQSDSWAELSKKHAEDSKKNLHNFIKNKNIEWNGDKNIINIGNHITISITYL
jgi:hypothetical protein